MKRFLLLSTFLFLVIQRLNAQDVRWMYLNHTADGTIYLVDTLADDIQQLSNYSDKENIVLVWANIYQKMHTKKGSQINKTLMRMAIDTTNKQYQIKSYTRYTGDKITKSFNNDYVIEWTDVIPGSIGDDLVRYVRSLNNPSLKYDLIVTAKFNYNPYSPSNKKITNSN